VLDPETGERSFFFLCQSGVELADLLLKLETASRLGDIDTEGAGIDSRVLRILRNRGKREQNHYKSIQPPGMRHMREKPPVILND
jgi:hypothetical protein